MSDDGLRELGKLLGLIVHDLRNPAATLSANISFLQETSEEALREDEDAGEALADMRLAITELSGGLDQVACIARWLGGEKAVKTADGDVIEACRAAAARVDDVRVDIAPPDEQPLWARGGATAAEVVKLLLLNARQHSPGRHVHLRATREGETITVEVHDDGPAIAPELAEDAFTIAGQNRIKKRADGRYGRTASLLAARAIADAIGARIESGGEPGAAFFRLYLKAG